MKFNFKIIEYDKKDNSTYLILLTCPLLLTLYWYYGNSSTFLKLAPSFIYEPMGDFWSHIFQFVFFFILMFIIPLVILKFVIKKPLKDFGFGFGDKKFGLTIVALTVPLLVVPSMYFASKMPDVRLEYPLAKIIITRHDLIFWYESLYAIFYYIAWEFYFRGFMLFGLKDRFGASNAILIQTIASCLVHLGKPEGETLGAIPVGIILGWLALRTNSFWYVWMIHACLGILSDLFVVYF